MENCPFRQKINKQHNVVIKQLTRFRNVWQGKTIDPDKLQTYCNSVTYISQLHSTYVHNCMQYFTPMMKEQMFQVNKDIIQDLVGKIRHSSTFSNSQRKQLSSIRQKRQVCQLCQSKVRQVDVKIIKQQLSDDAFLRRTLLKKIYADMGDNSEELFTRDEDEVFFKFLNRILVKKQEVLAMQTKEINSFLVEVTKSFSDLNFLTEYTPLKLNPTDYRENYKQQLSKTISQSLNKGFQTKIHPWMQKVFEHIKKNITLQHKQDTLERGSQTGEQLDYIKKRSEYITSSDNKKQMEALKIEIEQNTVVIEDLKSKLIILQKQKKELEEYFANEVQELMLAKREIQVKLRKTETDFFTLKQSRDEQVASLTKKLKHSRKGTDTNQSQKSQISQINKTQNTQKTLPNDQSLQITTKKKKKSPINRLLSNKSLIDKQLFTTDNKIQLSQDKSVNLNELSMKKTTSEFSGFEKNDLQKGDQSMKEIKKTKKSLKKVGRPLSKSKKGLEQQQKVQFKLENQSLLRIKKKQSLSPSPTIVSTIMQTVQTSKNQSETELQQPSPKLQKKKSSAKNTSSNTISNSQKKKPIKRGLSIQMSISPITKVSRETLHRQQSQQFNTTIQQESQSSFMDQTTMGESKNILASSRKKVFAFVPLQNQQEYVQLKQKITDITSKIEMRNTQRLKSSIKNIHEPQLVGGNNEVGRVYGFSLFNNSNKKSLNKSQNKTLSNQNSMEMREDQREDENCVKENGDEGQVKTIDRSIQTSIKHITGTVTPSLLDQISQQQRQSLLQQLKQQSVIPKTITFHHYQLMVRKLFNEAQQQSSSLQPDNTKSPYPRNSLINNQELSLMNKFSKQTQSVKINIDAKFLDEVRYGKGNVSSNNNNSGKMILNLPKLNQLSKGSPNSSSKGHFNFNTMREQVTVCHQNLNDLTDLKISPEKNKENYPTPSQNLNKNNQLTPSAIKSPSNSSKFQEIFTPKDIQIFFQTQLSAFQYQQSSKHNFKFQSKQLKPSYKPTEQEKQLISSLYSILVQVRSKNHQVYHKICSFVKYPYQTVKHGFDFINIGKDISLQVWNKYLYRIFAIRMQKDQRITFGSFIKPFEEKLVELLILVNK